MILLWTLTAAAAPPDGLRPVVAPLDVQAQYDAFRKERGLMPSSLACRPLWPRHAQLCFRRWEDGSRAWVHQADLTTWQTDLAGLEAAVRAGITEALGQAELKQVEGMAGAQYLEHIDTDGWAGAAVLVPDLLVAKLGAAAVPIHVAVPSESVLVAWTAGSPDLDKVMAVGALEMFEAQAGGVTPTVFEWSGDSWRPFGTARASETEPKEEQRPSGRTEGASGADGTRTHDL